MKKVLSFISIILATVSLSNAQIFVNGSGSVSLYSTAGAMNPVQAFGSMLFSTASSGTASAAYITANAGYSTPTTPDYNWWYDSQTGIFHPSNGVIGFTTLGIERMHVSANSIYFTNTTQTIYSAPSVRTTNNYSTATAPDYTWWGNDQTGIFHPTPGNIIGFTTAGVERMRINGSGQVAIGSAGTGSYTLYVSGTTWCTTAWSSSDIRYKKNIKSIDDPLAKILKINGKSYEYRTDEFKNLNFDKGATFGLIAQELKEVIPEAVKEDSNGYFAVNYNAIIPVLVEAIKEQQKQIEQLKTDLNTCCTTGSNQNITGQSEITGNSAGNSVLFQNNPNPFSESTTIKYTLADNIQNASILVFDMQGVLIKTYDNLDRSGALKINGGEFKAGMYMYTLVVNGKEIDTKRMILTK